MIPTVAPVETTTTLFTTTTREPAPPTHSPRWLEGAVYIQKISKNGYNGFCIAWDPAKSPLELGNTIQNTFGAMASRYCVRPGEALHVNGAACLISAEIQTPLTDNYVLYCLNNTVTDNVPKLCVTTSPKSPAMKTMVDFLVKHPNLALNPEYIGYKTIEVVCASFYDPP